MKHQHSMAVIGTSLVADPDALATTLLSSDKLSTIVTEYPWFLDLVMKLIDKDIMTRRSNWVQTPLDKLKNFEITLIANSLGSAMRHSLTASAAVGESHKYGVQTLSHTKTHTVLMLTQPRALEGEDTVHADLARPPSIP